MEVILVTDTTFLSHDLCEKDESRRNNHFSENEPLEEACWNGWLKMVLPEIFGESAKDNHLYLWELKAAASFLQLNLGEAPAAVEDNFSIIPDSFLSRQSYN